MQLFTSQWDVGRKWLGVCECYWQTDSVMMSSDRELRQVLEQERWNLWRKKNINDGTKSPPAILCTFKEEIVGEILTLGEVITV